jgi:hypothetical protein
MKITTLAELKRAHCNDTVRPSTSIKNFPAIPKSVTIILTNGMMKNRFFSIPSSHSQEIHAENSYRGKALLYRACKKLTKLSTSVDSILFKEVGGVVR